MPSDLPIPDDLVVVGHVTGAYGVQGWIKIRAYSADAVALTSAKTWWLDQPEMHDVDVLHSKMHSGDLVAQLLGLADRTQAEKLKGAAISVSRRHFPPLADNEFYWVDLVGLTVVNLQQQALGTVTEIIDNGAHPILAVTETAPSDNEKPRQRLIPYVDQFVKSVDLKQRVVVVDWGVEY